MGSQCGMPIRTLSIPIRNALRTAPCHQEVEHAFEEENVVYPAMRDHGQVEAADELVHDQGYVKQYLFDLSEMAASNPAWIVKVREFRADIEKHIRSEEEELFPKLKTALGDEGNAHVTSVMNNAGFVAA